MSYVGKKAVHVIQGIYELHSLEDFLELLYEALEEADVRDESLAVEAFLREISAFLDRYYPLD